MINMQEIWIDIKGYEKLYQVSNLGRVKSLERVIKNSLGVKRKLKEKILSLQTNKDGYRVILLRRKSLLVHRLVYQTFHGPIPEGKIIDHDDNNPANNRPENLIARTQRLNCSKDKESIYTGVSFKKSTKKWVSQIYLNKKKVHLGYFDTPELASKAYKEAVPS